MGASGASLCRLLMMVYFWLPTAMQFLVKERETDKKPEADQVLDTFDVLVEIHQGMHLAYGTNGLEKIGDEVWHGVALLADALHRADKFSSLP
jgi:hypothetical protein